MSALLQNDGKSHGNSETYPNKYKSFNEQPQPNWSEPKRPTEESEYADIHRLIETTKKELL